MSRIVAIIAAVLLLVIPHWHGHKRHLEETSVDARTRHEGPYQADLVASTASLRFFASSTGWISVSFPLYQAYISPAAGGWKLGFTGRWQDALVEPESRQQVFRDYFGHSKAQERFELIMTNISLPESGNSIERDNVPFLAMINGFQSQNTAGMLLQHFDDSLHISTTSHGILRTADNHKLAGLATAIQKAHNENLSEITEVRFDLTFQYYPDH